MQVIPQLFLIFFPKILHMSEKSNKFAADLVECCQAREKHEKSTRKIYLLTKVKPA